MSANDVLKTTKEKEAGIRRSQIYRSSEANFNIRNNGCNSMVDDSMLERGNVFFDGSSIAGWKAINESDMILKPDTAQEQF